MTKIYLIRHCEAEGNLKRTFQGHTDNDITELGEKQLEFLSKRFADIHLDKIYSSPLIRAVKTAKAAARGQHTDITILRGLIELNGGIVEDKPFKETFLAHPDLADAWDNHPEDFAPPGSEPMRYAYERIWNTIRFLVNENKGKTIAASTHGGVLRCLFCRLLYGDISRLKDTPWSDNTAISLLEIDDDMNVNLKFYNDASHLPDEFNPKRSKLSSILTENKK